LGEKGVDDFGGESGGFFEELKEDVGEADFDVLGRGGAGGRRESDQLGRFGV